MKENIDIVKVEAERIKKLQEQNNNNNNNSNPNDIIVSVSTTDLGCTLYYSDHNTILKSLKFNSIIATDAHAILSNLCQYTNRTSWLENLETAGAYVDKSGYHGRGLAIDLLNN